MPQATWTWQSSSPARRPHPIARCAAALAIAVAMLLSIAVTAGNPAEPRIATGSLAGQLLVATSEMPDPRFAGTVIYMVRHDASGAQGVVVNRPLGEVPLPTLLEQMGLDKQGASGSIRLHSGGPVETRRILVLHTAEYSAEGTLPVKDGISLT